MIKNHYVFYKCVFICLLFPAAAQGKEICEDGFMPQKLSSDYYGKMKQRTKLSPRQNTPSYEGRGQSFEDKMGYHFRDKSLRQAALNHEGKHTDQFVRYFQSTRLELLGDSVFNVCLNEMIIDKYFVISKNEIQSWRFLLSNTVQTGLALLFGVDKYITLNTSRSDGDLTPQMLADVLEAIVGAVYLDGGYRSARRLVITMLKKGIEKKLMDEYSYDVPFT